MNVNVSKMHKLVSLIIFSWTTGEHVSMSMKTSLEMDAAVVHTAKDDAVSMIKII